MAKIGFKALRKNLSTAFRQGITNAFAGDAVAAARMIDGLAKALEAFSSDTIDSLEWNFSNLAPNGGFESQPNTTTPPTGWNTTGGSGTTSTWNNGVSLVDSANAGNNSIQFTDSGSPNALITDKFLTEGGVRYIISSQVTQGGTLGAGDAFQLRVNEYDRDNVLLATTTVSSYDTSGSTTQQVRGTLVTNSSTRFAQIELYAALGGAGASSPTFTVDWVYMPDRRVSGANEYRTTWFRASNSTTETGINGSRTPVVFDSEDYNNAEDSKGYDNSTGIYTVPEDGYYSFHVSIGYRNTATTVDVDLEIQVNGTTVQAATSRSAADPVTYTLALSLNRYRLSKDDTVEVDFVTADTSWTLRGDDNEFYTYFEGGKVADLEN